MKQMDKAIIDKLQEIVDLQAEIQSQQDNYSSMLKADESFEKLKEVRLKIKYLNIELERKQDFALTLFHSFHALTE